MNMSVVSYYQPSVVTDPRNGSFYFPSFSISSEFSSILSFRFSTICFMRNNQVYSTLFKSFTKRIRICCFIINESLYCLWWPPSSSSGYRYIIKSTFNQFYFCRGRPVQVVPHRNSLAACHHHPLRTLSTFGFSDAEPPFLAGEKLPSANVSAQSNCPFSSSSERKDLHAFNHAPLCSHSSRRRQHVEGEGYSEGKSFQRAPLRRTHKIPSKQRRSEIRLRPFRCLLFSRKGDIFSHCLSVNSVLNRLARRESSFVKRRLSVLNLIIANSFV